MHVFFSRIPQFLAPGRRLAVAVLALGLLVLAGCDGFDGVDEQRRRCEVFNVCGAENPLRLSLVESEARPPANVSVLFKADTGADLPLANLTPSNFEIYENEQRVSRFEADLNILPKTGQFRYSIVLLLDLSGSIVESESLEPLKEAAQQFVDAILVEPSDPRYGEVEMSIWWFDGQAEIQPLVGFSPSPSAMEDGIETITPEITVDNSTNLYGAVVQSVDELRTRIATLTSQDVLSAGSLVLFTDGTDQAGRVSRSDALRAVARVEEDVSIYTIGLGGEIDVPTLEDIGLNGFVSATNLDDLVPRFQEIGGFVRAEANSYYLVEYCSPKRSGENELTIRIEVEEQVGLLTTEFSAADFTSGCRVSGAQP